MGSKPDSYLFTGTHGQLVSIIQTLAVTPPSKLGDNWEDISPPKQKLNSNRTTYKDKNTGLEIVFDKKTPGSPGYKGTNHYHIKNPNMTGDKDRYLDINGNPCAKGSKESHIVI